MKRRDIWSYFWNTLRWRLVDASAFAPSKLDSRTFSSDSDEVEIMVLMSVLQSIEQHIQLCRFGDNLEEKDEDVKYIQESGSKPVCCIASLSIVTAALVPIRR